MEEEDEDGKWSDAMGIITESISQGAALEAAASRRRETVVDMHHYVDRLGLKLSLMPMVHVAGTKGKGSTCCMVEAVLRGHGLRTGLFTSPHLVHITERIRLNGTPVSPKIFAEHVQRVWGVLRQEGCQPMPSYFRLLTLVGLSIFAEAAVDIVVMEVGVGGRFDATNVIPAPLVCGVTTLDLDHTAVLGETLPEIAWEKGGIFKKGCPALLSVEQSSKDATAVLESCAAEAGGKLCIVGPVSSDVDLGLPGDHQRVNAGLALALCSVVLQTAANSPPSKQARDALKSAEWPGRCQELQHDGLSVFLDGAHTQSSIRHALQWFLRRTAGTAELSRVLIFNCSHERDSLSMLRYLHGARPCFSAVVFMSVDGRPSRFRLPSAHEILGQGEADAMAHKPIAEPKPEHEDSFQWQNTLRTVWDALSSKEGAGCNTHIAAGGGAALSWIKENFASSAVLATGSLYVVASMLKALQWHPARVTKGV